MFRQMNGKGRLEIGEIEKVLDMTDHSAPVFGGQRGKWNMGKAAAEQVRTVYNAICRSQSGGTSDEGYIPGNRSA